MSIIIVPADRIQDCARLPFSDRFLHETVAKYRSDGYLPVPVDFVIEVYGFRVFIRSIPCTHVKAYIVALTGLGIWSCGITLKQVEKIDHDAVYLLRGLRGVFEIKDPFGEFYAILRNTGAMMARGLKSSLHEKKLIPPADSFTLGKRRK